MNPLEDVILHSLFAGTEKELNPTPESEALSLPLVGSVILNKKNFIQWIKFTYKYTTNKKGAEAPFL
jgi:hypothetical protein